MKKINEAAFLKPWAMKEDVVTTMRDIVLRHLSGEKLSPIEIAARTDGKKEAPPYEVVEGTARISIYGVISKRMSWIQQLSSSGVSVLEIEKNIRAAIDDPKVERILLDIDSPGGSSDGVAELSDFIFSLRDEKEVVAFANGQMCSAAYWIGSAAAKVYASSGAMVGSIGVYAVVDDYTHANWQSGIKTEVIKAGKNKAAGHPDKPFTQEDRSVIQTEVNMVYDLFIDAVARNRGISVEDASKVATGDIFIGKAAVDKGLVDGITSFDAVLKSAVPEIARSIQATAGADLEIDRKTKTETKHKEEVMFEIKTATPDQLKAENRALADALIAEGRAAGLTEGKQAGIEEGKKSVSDETKTAMETVKAENDRVAKIVEATPTGMEALAFSAIKEKKTIEATKDSFLKAFKKEAPENVGASADQSENSRGGLSAEEQDKVDYSKDLKLQAEFGSEKGYLLYKKAEREGRIKILKK